LLITYLRSSSIGTYSLCPFQFYMQYGLGIPSKPGFKTERGSAVHKALELLAKRKLAEQESRAGFYEEELGRELWAEDITLENAVDLSWDYYTKKNESGYHWPQEEYDNILGWTKDVVGHGGGIFSPLERKILYPELYFDIALDDQPWAWYDFPNPYTGERLTGYLAIKGTMDLLTEPGPGIIENLDWKSGRQWNWSEDKPKEYEDLLNDSQLLLYFLAMTRLFPEYKQIFVTIYFAQTKSPFTLPFSRRDDVPKALDMLKRNFLGIRNDMKPHRIMDDPKKRWKCKSFCHYGKVKKEGTNISICDYYNNEVQQLGIEKVMAKHGKPSFFSNYNSGGGLSNRIT
jgi:hypothetical protein